MQPLRYAKAWLAAGVVLLGFGLESALTASPLLGLGALNDKLAHAAGFLAFMVWFGGIFERRHLLRVALGLVAYGVLIEALQALTPTRQAEFPDLAADVAGVLLGWVLCTAGLSRWCAVLESWLARPSP